MNTSKPIIQIKNLSKSFQNGQLQVLNNINLDIYKGDIFGIIGESGAGKSTLVRCINYLEVPTGGDIFFDDKHLGSLKTGELLKVRQSMGMIFQHFNLLMQRSVLDNVCFPLEVAGINKKTAQTKALRLLELVGIPDKANEFPARLSGGQKQRVAIARALATEPKVLLCDEATSALDPSTTSDILELLKSINQTLGLTVVIITHEMDIIERICNRVAVIDKQGIVETGPVKDIFFSPKSEAAKKFIFSKESHDESFTENRNIRIVFDGNSSFEPVIADMVLRFKKTVNIIYANTKDIGGKAYGQMIIQLPDEPDLAERMVFYLKEKGHTVEEVSQV
jgi:D-methionine transport system ATP-binding protein